MVETQNTKKVREVRGQKSDANLCPDDDIKAIVSAVYDFLAKVGLVPSVKSVGRPVLSDSSKLSALTWHEDGATPSEVGAALKCLEHDRPHSEFQKFLKNEELKDALRKKGRRAINEGMKLDEKIQSLMKGEGREEYEQKMILSAKEKKMRFTWTFMHFLDWWMEWEEQFEYYAKN